MPIYVYRCGCGVRFEHLATMTDTATPGCPVCGGATSKVPAGFSLHGQADPGLSKNEMPQTWRGVYDGSPEYVNRMRRTWEQRQKLEERHPEIAGDQRPILAHEGRYERAPLRAGDIPLTGTAPTPGHGHSHGHGHGRHGAASGGAPSEGGAGTPGP
jgi:putative FmdB family regulatory protein